MSDIKIERKKITELTPDPENANEGTERGLRILDDSVTELGAGRSGLVDKNGTLLAGNKTQERLVDHGFEDVIVVHAKPTEWVVVQRDDLDLNDPDPNNPARRMAYYDNVASQHMQWNVAQLLKDKESGVDLSKLWTKDELAALVADAQRRNSGQRDAATQRDQIGEAHKKWGAALGDLWLIPSATRLGVHRVLCGDATDEGVVKRLLDGLPSQPNLMVTDPPYGVDYDPAWRKDIHPDQQYAMGKVQNDDRVDWSQAYRLFPGNVAYVWHAGKFASQVEATLIASGFETRYHIVWVKQHFALSRGDYHWQHEPVFYMVRKGATANWQGSRTETTTWFINNLNPYGQDSEQSEDERTGHGTQKPIECMRRPMVNNSAPGEYVYDPFLGSGTTLVAAEACGRYGAGCELDPQYVSVILERMKNLGLTPERAN